MDTSTFLDTHSLKNAFLGNILDRLVELIVEQGGEHLAEKGISFPPRAVSTVLLIAERGDMTAADIAKELKQPHQLVTQRIELLIKQEVIARTPDPNDGRRKVLILTDKGKTEVDVLSQALAETNRILSDLQTEIGCNLADSALKAIKSLSHSTIKERALNDH